MQNDSWPFTAHVWSRTNVFCISLSPPYTNTFTPLRCQQKKILFNHLCAEVNKCLLHLPFTSVHQYLHFLKVPKKEIDFNHLYVEQNKFFLHPFFHLHTPIPLLPSGANKKKKDFLPFMCGAEQMSFASPFHLRTP